MKLSILIPVYNARKYIGNCLDSLINQDIPKNEYEIIVMDDGSTDDSYEIVNNYAKGHENIHLYTQNNIGIYATRNKLLKLAKGDYVYNLDADDYIVHNTLKTILNTAKQNDLDILGFNSISTSEMNLFSSKTENVSTNAVIYNGIDFLSKNKYHDITVWWYIISRDFILRNKICFEKGNPMEDGPFTLRTIFKAERVMHLEMDIHRYVQVPTSIMNNENQDHLNKMVENYINLTHRYNSLILGISKKNDPKLLGVIYKIKHWRDLNVRMLFYRFIKVSLSLKKIDNILDEFKEINAYPLTYFDSELNSSIKSRLITFLFNHRYFFYSLLYPMRILYKYKLIKFP